MKLFIIGSPWHAAVANAIIKKEKISDSIIIAERLTDQSIEQIKSSLNREVEFIFDHDKTRFDSIYKHGIINSIKKMNAELSRIEDSIKTIPKISQVFYFNFYSPITRKIIYTLKETNKDIILSRVEDGICDYFDFNFINHNKFKIAAKNTLATLLLKSKLYLRRNRELFTATSEYYCFFPEKIGSAWKTKIMISLADYSAEIRENFHTSEKSARATSLIIGQTLFEDGITSLSEEISIYSSAASKLPPPVTIKLHPRSSKEKAEAIEKRGIQILKTSLPAESIICAGDYKTVIGMWSNTIIYSSCLFGVASFTMTHQLVEKNGKNNPHLIRIHNTLCEKFDDQYKDYRKAKTLQ